MPIREGHRCQGGGGGRYRNPWRQRKTPRHRVTKLNYNGYHRIRKKKKTRGRIQLRGTRTWRHAGELTISWSDLGDAWSDLLLDNRSRKGLGKNEIFIWSSFARTGWEEQKNAVPSGHLGSRFGTAPNAIAELWHSGRQRKTPKGEIIAPVQRREPQPVPRVSTLSWGGRITRVNGRMYLSWNCCWSSRFRTRLEIVRGKGRGR